MIQVLSNRFPEGVVLEIFLGRLNWDALLSNPVESFWGLKEVIPGNLFFIQTILIVLLWCLRPLIQDRRMLLFSFH
jgi:hypothetical protein